jgi:hypothetical protein
VVTGLAGEVARGEHAVGSFASCDAAAEQLAGRSDMLRQLVPSTSECQLDLGIVGAGSELEGADTVQESVHVRFDALDARFGAPRVWIQASNCSCPHSTTNPTAEVQRDHCTIRQFERGAGPRGEARRAVARGTPGRARRRFGDRCAQRAPEPGEAWEGPRPRRGSCRTGSTR